MKKIIIYTSIILAIILLATVLVVRSFGQNLVSQKVSFDIMQTNINVTIHEEVNETTGESKLIDEFNSTKSINLPKGKYYYLATGEHINPTTVRFSVPEETSIMIDPDYDPRYLASLLEKEVPIIDQLIETTYSKVTNGYTIHPGKFYKQGQWYATIINDSRSTNDDPYEDYRIVLNKQNGNWVATTTPEISLSKVSFPEIPREILSDINNSTPESLVQWSHTDSFNAR